MASQQFRHRELRSELQVRKRQENGRRRRLRVAAGRNAFALSQGKEMVKEYCPMAAAARSLFMLS